MSYLLKPYEKVDCKFNLYHDASATIGNNEAITFASEDTSFGKNFSLTTSGASFTLPNDSKTYYLEASVTYFTGTGSNAAPYHIIIQWYDVTNSTYVGTKGIITAGSNLNEGRSGDVVGDECARFVTNQANEYQLKLVSYNGIISHVDTTSSSDLAAWYTTARCLIWRY